jgi:hypothetical protein
LGSFTVLERASGARDSAFLRVMIAPCWYRFSLPPKETRSRRRAQGSINLQLGVSV